VPTRLVYLTTGPNRTLRLGRQIVEMKHAPRWQLALPGRPAGEAVRALAWLGPSQARPALASLERMLPPSCLEEMASVTPILPAWMAAAVDEVAEHAG
jgi:hypothetical protein